MIQSPQRRSRFRTVGKVGRGLTRELVEGGFVDRCSIVGIRFSSIIRVAVDVSVPIESVVGIIGRIGSAEGQRNDDQHDSDSEQCPALSSRGPE